MNINPLIEPAELHALLQKGSVKTVDATYGIPGFPASVLAAMERARIGDAVFFNIDAVADHSAPYPHTLPSAEDFAQAVGAMGIGNNDMVVVYDQNGLSFAAARAWWMFRVFGHDKVRVLNGGLPAWIAAQLPTQTGSLPAPAAKKFNAVFKDELYRSFDQIETGGDNVIDARAAARFSASVHSLDGDVVPAHIPGSHNQPFSALLDERGRMKSEQDVAGILFPHIAPGQKTVVSCGSGITACVLALGFSSVGQTAAVYDGSWTEWADRNALR